MKIDGRLNGIQWRVLRTLLLALGAVYLAFAAREFYGAWVADHPSVRPASSQLDGRVSGKVWIDDLSLAPKEQ